jgi:uncharacterized protein YjbJ (UPF0337 family)
LVGQIVGKAKTAIGGLLGNEDLEREGNLQQAQAEAEVIAAREKNAADVRRQLVSIEEERSETAAERERLRTELEAEDLQGRIEETAERSEHVIAQAAYQKQAEVQRREELEQRAASATEEAALHRRAVQAAEAARLQREARNAERTADTIDPEA